MAMGPRFNALTVAFHSFHSCKLVVFHVFLRSPHPFFNISNAFIHCCFPLISLVYFLIRRFVSLCFSVSHHLCCAHLIFLRINLFCVCVHTCVRASTTCACICMDTIFFLCALSWYCPLYHCCMAIWACLHMYHVSFFIF